MNMKMTHLTVRLSDSWHDSCIDADGTHDEWLGLADGKLDPNPNPNNIQLASYPYK